MIKYCFYPATYLSTIFGMGWLNISLYQFYVATEKYPLEYVCVVIY